MKLKIYLLVGLFGMLGIGPFLAKAHAEIYFIDQKQEYKAISRWGLFDFFDGRDRTQLQNLRISVSPPSPYDFYVGVNFQNGHLPNGLYDSAWNLQVAAYASIYGLEFQRQFSDTSPQYLGMFHVRFLGRHDQDSSITADIGARELTIGQNQLWNPLAGLTFNLYLNRFVGMEALYHHYFQGSAGANQGMMWGDRYELSAFVEYRFARITVGYFDEFIQQLGLTGVTRQGPYMGFKLFF